MIKSLKREFKEFLAKGIDWVMACGAQQQGINAWTETLSGAAPHSVTFAGASLPDMADANYGVMVNGETASSTHVDESTKTTTGFDILGGADTEVVHIVVFGRLEGMPAE